MDGKPSSSNGFSQSIAGGGALRPRESIVGDPTESSDLIDSVAPIQTTTVSREPSRPIELPEVLEQSRFEENYRRLFAQFSPVGPVEQALVRDLARQVTSLDRWGAAAEAVERNAVRGLPQLITGLTEHDDAVRDAVLAGAMSSDSADRCERHSMARSRGLCRVLDKLEELQARRQAKENVGVSTMPPAFPNNAICEAHLVNRLRNELRRCGKCGEQGGCFLHSRKSWECRACRAHTGLRAGTVMAGSALPLAVWFNAIRLLLWRPTISTAELSEQLGLRRLTTVRTIAQRIREAMSADDASARLAGLDQYFARAVDDLN